MNTRGASRSPYRYSLGISRNANPAARFRKPIHRACCTKTNCWNPKRTLTAAAIRVASVSTRKLSRRAFGLVVGASLWRATMAAEGTHDERRSGSFLPTGGASPSSTATARA